MFPRSGVQIRVYVCTGDAIFALWTSTGTTIWTSPFCVWRLLPFGRALLYCLSIPADAGMGVTVPPCNLLVPPAGGTRLSQLLLGWAFLCPLLYGGPVGTRRGLTAQEENEGECVVYGLVIRMTQLQLVTSPRGKLRQEHSIPSAASERRCMSCARQCDRQIQGPLRVGRLYSVFQSLSVGIPLDLPAYTLTLTLIIIAGLTTLEIKKER